MLFSMQADPFPMSGSSHRVPTILLSMQGAGNKLESSYDLIEQNIYI